MRLYDESEGLIVGIVSKYLCHFADGDKDASGNTYGGEDTPWPEGIGGHTVAEAIADVAPDIQPDIPVAPPPQKGDWSSTSPSLRDIASGNFTLDPTTGLAMASPTYASPDQLAQLESIESQRAEAMRADVASYSGSKASPQLANTASNTAKYLEEQAKQQALAQGRQLSKSEIDAITKEAQMYAQQQVRMLNAATGLTPTKEEIDKIIADYQSKTGLVIPTTANTAPLLTSDYIKIGDKEYQIARYDHIVDGKNVRVEIYVDTATKTPELYSVNGGVKQEISQALTTTINLPQSQVELRQNIIDVAKSIQSVLSTTGVVSTVKGTTKVLTQDEITKLANRELYDRQLKVEFNQWMIDKGYLDKSGKPTGLGKEYIMVSTDTKGNVSVNTNAIYAGFLIETGRVNEAGIASTEMQNRGYPEVMVQNVTRLDANHTIGSLSADFRDTQREIAENSYSADLTYLTPEQRVEVKKAIAEGKPIPYNVLAIVGKLGGLFITKVDASPLNDKFEVGKGKIGGQDYTVLTWWHEFSNQDGSKYIEQLRLYVDSNGTPVVYRIGDNIPLLVSQIEGYSCTTATCRWDEKLEVKTTAQIIREQGLDFVKKSDDSVKTTKTEAENNETAAQQKKIDESISTGNIPKPEIPSPYLNDIQKGATNDEIKGKGYIGDDGKPITDAKIAEDRKFVENNIYAGTKDGQSTFIPKEVFDGLPKAQQLIIAKGQDIGAFITEQKEAIAQFITKDKDGNEQIDVIGALQAGIKDETINNAIRALFPEKQLDIIAKVENGIVTPYGVEKYWNDQYESGKKVPEIEKSLKEAGYSDGFIKTVASVMIPDGMLSDSQFKSMSVSELKAYAKSNPDDPRVQWLDPSRIKTGDISAKTALPYADAKIMLDANKEGLLQGVVAGSEMKSRDFGNSLDSMKQMISTKFPEGTSEKDKNTLTNAFLAYVGLPIGVNSLVATSYLIQPEKTGEVIKDTIKTIDLAKQKVAEFDTKSMITDWKGKNTASIALQLMNSGMAEDVAMGIAKATTETQSFGLYAGNFVLDVAKTMGATLPLTLVGSQLKFADNRIPSSVVDMAELGGGMVMFPIVFAGDTAKNLLEGKYVQTAGEVTGLGLTMVFGAKDIIRMAKRSNRVLPNVSDYSAVSIEATLGINKYDLRAITPSTSIELANKVMDFMNSRSTKESILDAFENGMTIKMSTPDGIIDVKITPMNAIRPELTYSVTDMANAAKGGAILDDIYNRGGITSKEVPTGDVGTSIYMSTQPALNFMGQNGMIIGFIRSSKDLQRLPQEIIDKLDWSDLDGAKAELAKLYRDGKLEAGMYPVMKWWGREYKIVEWEMWTTPGFKTYNIPIDQIPSWAKEEGVPTAVTYINSPVNAGLVKAGDKIPVFWQITENALKEGRRIPSLKEKYLAELLSVPSELRKIAYGFKIREPALETSSITSPSPFVSRMGVAETFSMNKSFKDDYIGLDGVLVTRNPQPMELSLTGGKYAEKRVGVDIIPYDSVNKTIYLIRSKGDKVPEGVYSFPGGGTDPKSAIAEYGKTWESNALGQLRHEIGIDVPLSDIYMLGIFDGRRKLYSLDGSRVLDVDAKGKPMNFRSQWNKGEPEVIEGIMWDGKPEVRARFTPPEIKGITSEVKYSDFKAEADKSLGKAYLKDYSLPNNIDELKNITFYLNKDKSAGYGINNKNGEIVNLFNNGVSGAGAVLYAESVLRGGKWENHYEWQVKQGVKYYEQFGFKEVGRTKDKSGIDIVFTEYALPKRDINVIIEHATRVLNGEPVWANTFKNDIKIIKPEKVETYIQKVQLMPAQYYMLEGFLVKHPELGITMENVEMYKGAGMEVLIKGADKEFAKKIREGTMPTEQEITRIGIERQKIREKLASSNLVPPRISGLVAEILSENLVSSGTGKGTTLYSSLIPFLTPDTISKFSNKVRSIVANIEAKAVEAKAKGADYDTAFKQFAAETEAKILTGEIELLPQKDWVIAPKERITTEGYKVEIVDEIPRVADPSRNIFETLVKDVSTTIKETTLRVGGDIARTLQDKELAKVYKTQRDALYNSIMKEYKNTYGKYPQRLEQLSIMESVRNVMDEANSVAVSRIKESVTRKEDYNQSLNAAMQDAVSKGKLNKDVSTVLDDYMANVENLGRVIREEYQTAYKNDAGYWALGHEQLEAIYRDALRESSKEGTYFSAVYERLLEERKPTVEIIKGEVIDSYQIKNNISNYASDNVYSKYAEFNNAYVDYLYNRANLDMSIIGDFIREAERISNRSGQDFISVFEDAIWSNSRMLGEKGIVVPNVIRNARNFSTEKAIPEILSKMDNRITDMTPSILRKIAEEKTIKAKEKKATVKSVEDFLAAKEPKKARANKEELAISKMMDEYDNIKNQSRGDIPYRAEKGNIRGINLRTEERVSPLEARRIIANEQSKYRTIYSSRREPTIPTREPEARTVTEVSPRVSETVREPIRDTVREPIRETPREPIREPTRETVREPVREPIREPIREPLRVPIREVIKGKTTIRNRKGEIIATATQKELDSALMWRQGKVYRAWLPPYNKASMVVTHDPIPDVKYETGVGSAYRSLVAKGLKMPDHLRYDMGIQVIDFEKSTDPMKPRMEFTENYNSPNAKKRIRTGVIKNTRTKSDRNSSLTIF